MKTDCMKGRSVSYEQFFRRHLAFIERNLKNFLCAEEMRPRKIHQAMQYAVFSSGKRFRPLLAVIACEVCGGEAKDALWAALAIELIHAYSLVHDDLPALDDDDMRRGKPACHKKFGEADAILAGDALLTLAFEWISRVKPAAMAVKILREISTAAGVRGMIGGQVADLEFPGKKKTLPEHDFISRNKTGALIRASAVVGAIAAGASVRKLKNIARYGECLGLAFQVVDDILDRDGYCLVLSKTQTVLKAKRLIMEAKKVIKGFGARAEPLIFIADFLMRRIPF